MFNFSRKTNRIIFYWILLTLSVSLAFATDQNDNRNYLLIGSMYLGPLFLVLMGGALPKIDIPIFSIIFFSITIQLIFYPTSRISTVLFSCMFYIYFLVAVRAFIGARMKVSELQGILKVLIYAYAIVLIIQQFCVLAHLPIFNFINDYNPDKTWKLNSLSAEPSHTARYLGVLMYSFLKTADLVCHRKLTLTESIREYKWVWMSFFWVMITMQSGTAMIIIAFILIRYIRPKNAVIIGGALTALFAIGLTSDFAPLKRSASFLQAVSTGNTNAMIDADMSASVRVVPAILCIQKFDISKKEGWIGEGIDSTSKWMSHYMPGVHSGWRGGAIAAYLLEQGIIVALLFTIFSFWCCYDSKNIIASIGFWLTCVIFVGVNMQIAWLCILMLYIDKRLQLNNEDQCVLR